MLGSNLDYSWNNPIDLTHIESKLCQYQMPIGYSELKPRLGEYLPRLCQYQAQTIPGSSLQVGQYWAYVMSKSSLDYSGIKARSSQY